MIPHIKNVSYPNRLKELGLPTVAYRRLRGDMIETYKIVHRLYDCEAAPRLNFVDNSSITRGHCYKLNKTRQQTRLAQNYFSNRIVDTWNSLPPHTVEAPSLNAFKNRIDKFWKDQEIKYNYNSPINLKYSPSISSRKN